MAKQFPDTNSRYGAPMGRASFGTPEQAENKIRVFRVRLDSGGYDDGGAYWGTGQALFCATDDADFRQFVRASGRLSAIAEFGIEKRLLAKPSTKEFKTWQALAGANLEHLNPRGKPVFMKLLELGY
jgi:hypothetical protein